MPAPPAPFADRAPREVFTAGAKLFRRCVVGLSEERKDITLNEMVERLVAEQSVRISRSALSAWLRGHGWTFKKSPRTHWSRIAPTF